MKCYIDRFKSKYDADNICKELLSFLSNETLTDIVAESKVLRLKCNLLKKTDMFKLPREKVENGILASYKTNEELNIKISEKWNSKLKSVKQKEKDLDYNEAKKILEKKEKPESLFKYATLFWSKNEEEFNLLGDKIYERYLSQKNIKKMVKWGEGKMDKNILDTSLGQLLEVFNNEKVEKQQQLEETIKQNSEEIKKLSQQMKIVIEFNKDIKKMLNGMTETIKTLAKERNNNESKINDKLYLIDEEVKEASKEVKQVKERSEQVYKKELKTISSNIKGISDSLKNQNKVLEKLEEVKEELREELNNVSNEINNLKVEKVKIDKSIDEKGTCKEEKVLKESQVGNADKINSLEKEEDNSEDSTFGDLLDELLKDK